MDKTCLSYFEWLCHIVDPEEKYKLLLGYLYSVDFYAILGMDRNRIDDALYFRKHYTTDPIFDSANVKVLEVMIALANRCATEYLGDLKDWFWTMIASLGLLNLDDSHFDEKVAANVIFSFLNREYEHDGHGGLFTVYRKDVDMRDMEIWYQMTLYLNEII